MPIFASETGHFMITIEQKVGITLCTSGSATRIAGSHLCKLEKGIAIIVSPALPTVEVESSPDFQECVIAVDMSTISGETAPFFPRMMPVLSASAPILRLSPEMERRVHETARHIAERSSVRPEEEMFRSMNERVVDLLCLQIILEIMYEMAVNHRPSCEKPSRGEQVFVGFMQSLGLHYAERYPVSRYAEESHLTVRHFSALIHQYSGQTPMQWIVSYTISQAKHLLSQTELSVKVIAEKLCFPEQFTFRKYFKTYAGESPTAFRRKK